MPGILTTESGILTLVDDEPEQKTFNFVSLVKVIFSESIHPNSIFGGKTIYDTPAKAYGEFPLPSM